MWLYLSADFVFNYGVSNSESSANDRLNKLRSRAALILVIVVTVRYIIVDVVQAVYEDGGFGNNGCESD